MENSLAKKTVVFLRSIPVAPYPRLEKVATVVAEHHKVVVLAWDREGTNPKIEDKPYGRIHRLRLRSSYGSWRFFLKLIVWQFYEFWWLMFHRFDAVHAYGLDTYFTALIVAKLKGKRILYDIHDFYADMISDSIPGFAHSLIKKLDLWLIGKADVVAIADDTRREQISGSHPKKLLVIYNVPDIDRVNVKPKMLPKDTFNIFYGGLVAKRRGLDTMIELVSHLRGVKLFLAGFGGDEQYYKNKIADKPNIEFLGKLSYDDLLGYSAASDLLFATYDPYIINHKYSSPNKLFEAMALAKPIIVSADSTMAEHVEKNRCGMIVKYGDEGELAQAIEKLKNDPKLAKELGQNGHKAYLSHYHWDRMAELVRNAYQTLWQ